MDQVVNAHAERVSRTPLQLWIVGVVSLAWNAMGAVDYVMTQTHNAAWLAAATPEQRAYFDHFPALMVAFWALGVWGALVGSVLLLARSRFAVTAFAVSLLGLAATSIYQWLIAPPPGGRSAGEIAFTLALWAVAIALFVFARRMQTKGVLR
jgi:hypothetical protein